MKLSTVIIFQLKWSIHRSSKVYGFLATKNGVAHNSFLFPPVLMTVSRLYYKKTKKTTHKNTTQNQITTDSIKMALWWCIISEAGDDNLFEVIHNQLLEPLQAL